MSHILVEQSEYNDRDGTPCTIPEHWTLRCDHDGCCAEVYLERRLLLTSQRRALTERAEASGWQLGRHGELGLDFCPLHVDPSKATIAQLRRLYYEHGMPLNPQLPVQRRKR